MTIQLSGTNRLEPAWGDVTELWNSRYVITGLHRQRADESVPAVRGFVRSPFNPLIYHSVRQAYDSAGFSNTLLPERKGILLGSMFVDAITQEEIWKDLIHGRKVSPIMFPQSVPSAIIGYLAKEIGIHGPMSCMGTSSLGLQLLLQQAIDWIEDDLSDAVIICCCDIPSIRAELWTKAYVGADRTFGGGVISFVVESMQRASDRNQPAVLTIPELMNLEQADSRERYHGMAFGLEEG